MPYPNFDDNDLVRDELKELLFQICEVDRIKEDVMFWTTADLSALVVIHGILAAKMQRVKLMFDRLDALSQVMKDQGE